MQRGGMGGVARSDGVVGVMHGRFILLRVLSDARSAPPRSLPSASKAIINRQARQAHQEQHELKLDRKAGRFFDFHDSCGFSWRSWRFSIDLIFLAVRSDA
jgi:hypothetical protein